MKRMLLAGIFILSAMLGKAQQDAQYSQYMFNGIYINPAYAGYRENLNLHAFYRSQWSGISGAPRSFSISVDGTIREKNVGLAFQLASDRLGAQQNLSAYASYAYRIKLGPDGASRLAIGLSAGLVQMGIDGFYLNPNDPEPDAPVGKQSTVKPDARFGVYFSNNSFYAGVSVDNLVLQYMNTDKYGYIPKSKMHCYATAGMLLKLSDDFGLRPSFLLKDDLGGPSALDLNTFLLYREVLWVGASYRTGIRLYDKKYLQQELSKTNTVVAALEIYPVKNLRVGYSYDIAVGPLQGYFGGSHEISVGFTIFRESSLTDCFKAF